MMKRVRINTTATLLPALVVVALAVGFGLIRWQARASTLAGDINNDGVVNIFDLSILLSDWNTNTAAADLNQDGTVNIFDLSILLSHWGQTAPTPTPTPTPTPSPTPAPYSQLVWSDEFNGAAGAAPDPTKWNLEQGGNGWGNSELECYTNSPANAQTNGQGQLIITAFYTPGHVCSDGNTNNYTSAKLDTKNLETLTYGRMEMRAQVPTASGMWPAFWALGTTGGNWPYNGEIDTMEAIGRLPATVQGHIHGPQYNADGSYDGDYGPGGTYSLASGTLSDTYHVYGVDWSPTQISFDFDGTTYCTITKAQMDASANPHEAWVFNAPFYMLLNLTVGGNWPGAPASSSEFPQQMLVDYVRVYQ
jgi:beta-glucanase (GH16 family)